MSFVQRSLAVPGPLIPCQAAEDTGDSGPTTFQARQQCQGIGIGADEQTHAAGMARNEMQWRLCGVDQFTRTDAGSGGYLPVAARNATIPETDHNIIETAPGWLFLRVWLENSRLRAAAGDSSMVS